MVAGVERALRAQGFYAGPSHGTAPVSPDRELLGRRTLTLDDHGYAVRELQLALDWQGFPSGAVDGRFGPRLAAAVARFQAAKGLPPDGVAGPTVFRALRHAPPRSPIPLVWPVFAPLTSLFGPRDGRFHEGLDIGASFRTPVMAAAPGRVTWARMRAGGWGRLVVVAHPGGVRTMYAHLYRIRVHVGEWVSAGTVVGVVGATGDARGPHLHFEVRVGAGAVDPLGALVRLG
jgi:murein DD-endopeptidase MepM/ murein hydrolase activator NlpD